MSFTYFLSQSLSLAVHWGPSRTDSKPGLWPWPFVLIQPSVAKSNGSDTGFQVRQLWAGHPVLSILSLWPLSQSPHLRNGDNSCTYASVASLVGYFLLTPPPSTMRPLNHTDAENEPTWKPVEFPGMIGPIVLQLGRALWQGKQAEGFKCLQQTSASEISSALLLGDVSFSFRGRGECSWKKLLHGNNSADGPEGWKWSQPRVVSLGYTSEKPWGQQHTLCLLRGFLAEPSEETAL